LPKHSLRSRSASTAADALGGNRFLLHARSAASAATAPLDLAKRIIGTSRRTGFVDTGRLMGTNACENLRSPPPSGGGELEQIQLLLGHRSVQTTERFLGCKQRVHNAVNDRIGLDQLKSAVLNSLTSPSSTEPRSCDNRSPCLVNHFHSFFIHPATVHFDFRKGSFDLTKIRTR
jgi:hypothetical protein